MPIVPERTDIAPQSPDISRMSRVDGCPECVTNTEPPRSVTPTSDGFVARYICSDCGWAWTTSWKDA